jgi:hypothetical protein
MALEAVAPLGVTVTEALAGRLYHTGATADLSFIVKAALAGTRTTIVVLVQDDALAVTFPNLTTPGFPKPVPRIVTLAPTTPWVGESERMRAGDTGGVVGGTVVGGTVVGGTVVGGTVVGGTVVGGTVVGGTVVGGTVVGGTVVGGTVVGGTVVGGTVVGGTVVGGTVVGGTVVGGTVVGGTVVGGTVVGGELTVMLKRAKFVTPLESAGPLSAHTL